ncbi:NADH dehydrogenase [ubiquinone] 1 alpha subcomplex assembly factor 4 isoform X3 [Augochlora pura]
MGNIYTFITRPLRSFNIENRAQRVLGKDKPIPAPQYPSTAKQKELVDKLYPNFLEEHYKKDKQLDDRLKNIYVTSNDPMEIVKPVTSTRPLPGKRADAEEYDFSYYDASHTPEGKCSLNQALTFLTNHVQSPDVYTVDKIAAEYKLDKNVVESILKHFTVPIFRDKVTETKQNDSLMF